jgi:hypothetical protein
LSIQKFDSGDSETHRQQGERISLLIFLFQNKKCKLKSTDIYAVLKESFWGQVGPYFKQPVNCRAPYSATYAVADVTALFCQLVMITERYNKASYCFHSNPLYRQPLSSDSPPPLVHSLFMTWGVTTCPLKLIISHCSIEWARPNEFPRDMRSPDIQNRADNAVIHWWWWWGGGYDSHEARDIGDLWRKLEPQLSW